jgi:hypothetical protein
VIATNRLPSSVFIVFLFWYFVFFLPLGIRGIPIWDIARNLPISAMLTLIGAAVGFGMVTMVSITVSASDEDRLWSGDRHREAIISLGAAPWSPRAPRRALPAELLASTTWWRRVCERSPAHAAAIKAVVETMYVVPKLPASPYPGGHRGRTLIEHSMAVVEHMLLEVKSWRYEGQFDKRGNLRVPLADPQKPHRFSPEEVPLLILAALAHDIGKLTCYVPVAGQPDDASVDTLRVVEAYPNHDQEGARLLRMIPEIMDLPFDDRTALITACGYYHHPFALPNADWVTDRVRSLTELLAHADIKTGISEGHTLTADVQDGYADSLDPAVPAADALPPAEELDDDDLDAAIAQAAGAAKASAQPTPSQATRPQSLPRELRMFMDSIRRPGAINGVGPQKNNRIAWKHGEYVYVIDTAMRAVVMNQNPSDLAWLAQAMETASGNAAPYTAALAEQLHAHGALMIEHEGRSYMPRRALFKMASKGSTRTVPVLVVRADFIPGAAGIKDAEPIKLAGPFWGEQSGRTSQEETAVAATEPTAPVVTPPADQSGQHAEPDDGPDDGPDDLVDAAYPTESAPTPESLETFSGSGVDITEDTEAEPIDPAVLEARRLFAAQDLDLDDLGIDLPPIPADSNLERGVETLETVASAVSPAQAPAPSAEEVAAYFIEMIQSEEFCSKHKYAVKERGGVNFALLPLDESSGRAVSRALDELRELGADLSEIKVAHIQASNQQAYAFKLPA